MERRENMSTENRKKVSFNVAGITFSKAFDSIADERPIGQEVRFRRDRDNDHDENAIAIYLTNRPISKYSRHIGYVPKRGGIQQDVLHCGGWGKIIDYGYTDDGGDTWNDEHRGRLQSITIEIEIPDNLKSYQRVTSFLKYFDASGGSDSLIKWAFSQGSTYDEYTEALNETSINGTAMHDAIEQYLRDGTESQHLPEGWSNFVEKYKPEPLVMEKRFFDDQLGVTGQYDFHGSIEWKGERIPVIIDWKSSKAPRLSHKLQASIYARNVDCVDGAMIVAFGAQNKQRFSGSFITSEQIDQYYGAMVKLSEIVKTLNIKPEAGKCIKA